MKKLFIITMMCLITLAIHAQSKKQFVDLGLPSGTLWKQANETIDYSYTDAIRYFDGFLPTSGQFKELIDYCQWKWLQGNREKWKKYLFIGRVQKRK